MKKIKYSILSSIALSAAFVITACGGNSGGGSKPSGEFNFSIAFASGRTDTLYVNEDETLEIYETNPGKVERTYTYDLIGTNADQFVTVSLDEGGKSFTVSPSKVSTSRIGIKVTETTSKKEKRQFFTITSRSEPANTGYNFSADTAKKAEILGKLEEYAMKNYLTGITLFENGGYVRYSSRVNLPTQNYVTGYGFGLLTEGSLTGVLPAVQGYEHYLRTAQSSDPGNINGWQATGSQVGDLFGYITSSFWGTKLNAKRNGYEWYPVLAADSCPDPIPMDGEAGVTIHKKYRVYVKTGNIAYRSVKGGTYDNRPVELEDYLTTFQLLLTQASKLTRGSELATDTSYGFKGAYSYFRKTKNVTPDQADSFWNDMISKDQLGIKGGHDATGDYIDFEFINPIDQFTAKYTLSSSLYSPLPKAYLRSIGGNDNWINAGDVFGTGTKYNADGSGTCTILNNVLCLGPFYLQTWTTDKEIVFTRNNNWFEYTSTHTDPDKPNEGGRYNIPGVHMLIVTGAQTEDDAIYNQFNSGLLDSTGIPVSRMKEKLGSDLKTKGDSTFKLNVNSCDQTRWDELFWSNKYPDVQKPKDRYLVKPWMSNKNFLNGLFWSINRSEFASTRGVNPSYNYFADAYLSDPVKGVSYNSTQAHKDAEDGFDPNLRNSNFGYDTAKATAYFDLAVKELVKSGDITLGTKENKTKIYLDIQWMYQNDETTYGQDIANYFTRAFNNVNVGSGCVELIVRHSADSDWQQVYNDHLMVGKFDLGFGAISGNSLNPLNFMEVLKSDNSSGFTLNWGADTAKVDENDPITFDVVEDGVKVSKSWSYDAAWAAADHGAVIKNGRAVDSVTLGYTKAPTSQGAPVNVLTLGALMEIPFEFVDVDDGVDFDIDRVQLSLVGYGSLEIDESNIRRIYKEDGVTLVGLEINFDNTAVLEKYDNMTFAQYANKLLFDGLKLQKAIDALDPNDPKYDEKVYDLSNPLAYDKYDTYWGIDIYYNITIAGSVPAENYYYVEKTNSKPNSSRYSLAR